MGQCHPKKKETGGEVQSERGTTEASSKGCNIVGFGGRGEEATSQGTWAVLDPGKGKEIDSPLGTLERHTALLTL